MKQERVQRRTRVETAIERRDRVAPILDVFNRIPKLNAIRADITIAIAAADAGGTGLRRPGVLPRRDPAEALVGILDYLSAGGYGRHDLRLPGAGVATTFLFHTTDIGRFGRRGLRGSLQGSPSARR